MAAQREPDSDDPTDDDPPSGPELLPDVLSVDDDEHGHDPHPADLVFDSAEAAEALRLLSDLIEAIERAHAAGSPPQGE